MFRLSVVVAFLLAGELASPAQACTPPKPNAPVRVSFLADSGLNALAKWAHETTCVEYDYTDKGRIRLDRKSDIMEEYGFSPDRADSLAMTFAYPVADFSDSQIQLEPTCYDD